MKVYSILQLIDDSLIDSLNKYKNRREKKKKKKRKGKNVYMNAINKFITANCCVISKDNERKRPPLLYIYIYEYVYIYILQMIIINHTEIQSGTICAMYSVNYLAIVLSVVFFLLF